MPENVYAVRREVDELRAEVSRLTGTIDQMQKGNLQQWTMTLTVLGLHSTRVWRLTIGMAVVSTVIITGLFSYIMFKG